jgi:CO/xanthine dehydrogenase Mo-binding subunit
VENEKATVWASTQRPFSVREEIARAIGLQSDRVRVITPFVGGGFGGKSPSQQAVEAAILAKITGKPVQVAWTREDEFFHDAFRPAAIIRIKSGIDRSSRITFWDYKVYFAGSRGAAQFYDIPHHRTTGYGGWWGASGAHPFSTGTWRGPASNTNTFGREAHMDVMAAGAGMDPLEFRLKNLKDRRMKRVLMAVARKFGWESAPSFPGKRGWGVACGDCEGTYVAMMAEVDVDQDTGNIRVKRVACAQDMGLVINPDGAKMQMEGCIMMGLGYALSEEIHFKGGEIFDLNFGTYEIPRFSWMPKIETVLINDPQSSPKGGGEPAITCVGAVVANAVFDATGVRILDLPVTPERIKKHRA